VPTGPREFGGCGRCYCAFLQPWVQPPCHAQINARCMTGQEHASVLNLALHIRPCPREALFFHLGPPLQAEGVWLFNSCCRLSSPLILPPALCSSPRVLLRSDARTCPCVHGGAFHLNVRSQATAASCPGSGQRSKCTAEKWFSPFSWMRPLASQ